MDNLPDIVIILKNGNLTSQINAHRNVLTTNDYFKNLLTGPLKDNNANEITLEVSNIDICRDIIKSFYGTPVKFSSHKHILGHVKCCDYWLVPYEDVLTDDLKVSEEDFDLLLEIGQLTNYSDRALKIIARNIPAEYDLSGIPSELKERMIKMEQLNYVVSGDDDGKIKIWDLETGTKIMSLKGHNKRITCIYYIAEKNLIMSGSIDKTIKIWDLNTGSKIRILKGHKDGICCFCYIVEKNQIISGCFDGTIKIWDLNNGAELRTFIGHTDSVKCVCYVPERNQIISGSSDHTIKIWDLDTGNKVKTLHGHEKGVIGVFHLSEKNQLLSVSWDGTIKIYNLDTGLEIITKSNNIEFVSSVCYIPDKYQILFGMADASIEKWNYNTINEIGLFEGHTDMVCSMCYIPEKNQFASASFDNTIKIWDLDSGKDIVSTGTEFKTLNGHTNEVKCVCHVKKDSSVAKRLKKID